MESNNFLQYGRCIYLHKIYRHFKGNYYMVEGFCKHSETKESMVLYRAMYGTKELYVRPFNMFISEVDHEKYPDVKQKYRFQEVDELDIDYTKEV